MMGKLARLRMSNGILLKQPLNLLHPTDLARTNETDHSNNMAQK